MNSASQLHKIVLVQMKKHRFERADYFWTAEEGLVEKP
jgi:hypothetical protein